MPPTSEWTSTGLYSFPQLLQPLQTEGKTSPEGTMWQGGPGCARLFEAILPTPTSSLTWTMHLATRRFFLLFPQV